MVKSERWNGLKAAAAVTDLGHYKNSATGGNGTPSAGSEQKMFSIESLLCTSPNVLNENGE